MNEADGSNDPSGKPKVRVPYNLDTYEPVPLRSKDDIIAFDQAFRSITTGLPKPILLGSVMRLSETALPNWGIEINGENRASLMEYADEFYKMDDLQYTPERTGQDFLQAYKRRLQADCLKQMEMSSSTIVSNILRSSEEKKKEISICNLAAGAANVVLSVIATLGCDQAGKDILERTVFHLVDRPEKLARAEKNLTGLRARVEFHAKSSADFLLEMQDTQKKFDYVISVSQFHRKPFLSDYLASIRSIMNDKALLVAADWHSPLTLYPSGVFQLLRTLNVPQTRLEYFQDLFGPFMHHDSRTDSFLEENKALSDHVDYWERLGGCMGSCSTDPSGLKVRIMSAFLTQKQLAGQLEKSGFDTERDKIRSAFPGESACALPRTLPVRIRNRSDTAVVTLAVRR